MKNTSWFILGREPLLSTAEISTVLHTTAFNIEDRILKVDTSFDTTNLLNQLGGTIKIGQELGNALTEEQLLKKIIEELKTVEGKIHFGLSVYSNKPQDTIKKWGLYIKKTLKAEGLSVRYVENREAVLSSVTVEKNGLTKRGKEFLIYEKNNTYSLANTLAVQPFEEWGKRDFGRPGRDDTSGMLPPKLATMMINLSGVVANNNTSLLDPFCGSGTILTEALHLGFTRLTGTDVSPKAIEDTKKNIAWAQNNQSNNTSTSINILELSSSDLSQKISTRSIDLIVTEPYLGKPLRGREKKEELQKQIMELKKIYLTAFKEFYKILKPKGTVVFVVPRFRWGNEWMRIACAEEIKKIGFKINPALPSHDFLLYARPDQHVGREIWKFEKN
jgi:tRNA G10  N-methylase Trm11